MADGGSFIVNTNRKERASLARRYTKKSGVFATPVSFTSKPGETRASVIKAAEIFRDQAKKNASKFSRRIPAATYVQGTDEQRALVVTDGVAAPNAAPFEFAERHPLNYPNQVKALNRHGRAFNWVKQPRRSYMSNAANNGKTVDQAADIYAQTERDLLANESKFLT